MSKDAEYMRTDMKKAFTKIQLSFYGPLNLGCPLGLLQETLQVAESVPGPDQAPSVQMLLELRGLILKLKPQTHDSSEIVFRRSCASLVLHVHVLTESQMRQIWLDRQEEPCNLNVRH